MAAIRVLVADDSKIVRKAIRMFLEDRPEVILVGEAESLQEAESKSCELRPDVVVLDLHLAEDGVEPEQLKAALGGAYVVAITFGADEAAKILAEHIEAQTLLDKGDLSEDLIPAILKLAPVPRPA
jgi:DNA-binding NarL/FixJ family response regulator